jgi:hypothetical protein
MNKAIRLLRVSYWTGAVADGFFAIALLFPKLWGMALKIAPFKPDLQHRMDMAVGASLMFSWTVLLLWADRKPMERKGVLLLTVFPALTCLAITGIAAVVTGANSFSNMLPVFIMQSSLSSLFLVSYVLARRAESVAGLKKIVS